MHRNTNEKTIVISSKDTWPDKLLDYLHQNLELFVSWELRDSELDSMSVSRCKYDAAFYGLRACLKGFHLHGYHCTKLTNEEIDTIKMEGMCLQDKTTLNARIDVLTGKGAIKKDIGLLLKNKNQAGDTNREHRLWFCFFEPHLGGQNGIERFFRSWGGEALYNSHEDDPQTGNALKAIGTPCLVEAHVPISILNEHSSLDTVIVRNYIKNRGYEMRDRLEHEGYATTPISAHLVKNIIEFPDEKFAALTKCNEWDMHLA